MYTYMYINSDLQLPEMRTDPNESTKVHNPRRNQSTGITRIRYTVRCIRGSMRVRYLPRIGTVRYRYLYYVCYTRIIYRR